MRGEPASINVSRRLASLAVASGALAVVTVVLVAGSADDASDPADVSGGADWILGLLLILAPFLAACATRSLASSTLLRPLGGIGVGVAALSALVHVGVAVDAEGAVGWLFGAPAITSALLLLAAVIRGPDRAPSAAPERNEGESLGPGRTRLSPQDLVGLPPLDVITPLRGARDHSTKSVLSWLAAVALALLISVPVLRVLGWPRVEARVEAEVVDIQVIGDTTVVRFEGRAGDRIVRWAYDVHESNWELGERNVAYLDDDGAVHEDQQLGLAGVPLFGSVFLVASFALLSARRLWGVAIAVWDASHGSDRPRLGYAAVIDDPAPRAWRPLLAVWDEDPTGGSRLAKPDAVFRVDEDTCEGLESEPTSVVVRKAWIDTGPWQGAKPRWVGFEHGVAIPHRRSFFGRWYVGVTTRRSDTGDVVDLRHGPPTLSAVPSVRRRSVSTHRFRTMLAWRLLLVVPGFGFAFMLDDHGEQARITRPEPVPVERSQR